MARKKIINLGLSEVNLPKVTQLMIELATPEPAPHNEYTSQSTDRLSSGHGCLVPQRTPCFSGAVSLSLSLSDGEKWFITTSFC